MAHGALNMSTRELGRNVTARQLQLVLLSGLLAGFPSDTANGPDSALGIACGLPYAPSGCYKSAGAGDSAPPPPPLPAWRDFSPLPAIFLRSTSCKVSNTCPTFSACPGIGPGVEACINAAGTALRDTRAGDNSQESVGATSSEAMTSAISDVAVQLSMTAMNESCDVYGRESKNRYGFTSRDLMPTWLLPSHCRGAPDVTWLKAILTCPTVKGLNGSQADEVLLKEAELLLLADDDWPLTASGPEVVQPDAEGDGSWASCVKLGDVAVAAATRRGDMSIFHRKVKLEEGAGWVGGVVLLRDVYVDRWGRVFNDTHFFHAGRCSDDSALQVRPLPRQEEMSKMRI